MNLYDLSIEYIILDKKMEEWAVEHEGDITDFPLDKEFVNIEGELFDKCLNLGVWIKNMLGEAIAIKTEEKNLQQRRQALENKAARIKKYVENSLPTSQKLSNAQCQIGWRKSKSVEIALENMQDLPEKYHKWTCAADKKELKVDLESGKKIEGVKIITKNNIQIK